MVTPQLAVAADLHLAPNAWVKHPDLRGDAAYALHQIVSYCIIHRLPLLLLGDIFDKKRPDPESVFLFVSEMERMQKAGLRVYFIQGDHDFDALSPWPSVHPWPMHIHKLKVEVAPHLVLYGLDWTPRTHTAEELAALPDGFDFLATHLAWSDVQGIGGTDADFAMVRKIVPTRILSGDYHKAGEYTGKNGDNQLVTLHSPGSTCMQSLDEPNDKSFLTIGRVGDGYDIKRVALETRHFYRFNVNTPADVEPVLAMIGEEHQWQDVPEVIRKPGLHVKYNDAIPEIAQRLTAAAGDRYHLFLVPWHQTEDVTVDQEAMPVGAFDSLLGAIRELSASEPRLYDGLARLLRSPDRLSELDAMYEEYQQQCKLRTEAHNAAGTSNGPQLVQSPGA